MDFLPKSCVLFLLSLLVSKPARAQTPTPEDADSVKETTISNIDLSKPFATREAWRFIATQGPRISGNDTASGGEEPGRIQLCLRAAPSPPCDPQLQNALHDEPHYLETVEIVYPRGSTGRPLLLVRTGGVHGTNGSQSETTQMLAYENAQNHFVLIYQEEGGRRNNNEEVRYISSGRLMGDIISVDPTENAPYAYWVTVNVLTPEYTYKTVLRYRSATHYGDSNPLAVIDSEMPNIEQRLGYWKPGMALPLPPGGCPIPRLIRMELWCN